jgi:hypothetical protein
MMPHQRARTWTLGELDRARGYRLWFDPTTDRWEVAYADGDTGLADDPGDPAEGGRAGASRRRHRAGDPAR